MKQQTTVASSTTRYIKASEPKQVLCSHLSTSPHASARAPTALPHGSRSISRHQTAQTQLWGNRKTLTGPTRAGSMREPSASCASASFVPASAQGGVVRLVDQLKTTALPEHTRRFTRTGQAGHPATGCRQVGRYSLIKSTDTFLQRCQGCKWRNNCIIIMRIAPTVSL